MEKKKQIKKWLLIGVIVFVVLVAVELIAVCIVDSNMEKESFALNTLDKVVSNEYAAEECSHIVKRELTADEIIQQKILQKKHSLMIYNNIGLAEDIVLPDGSWFLDKSPMIIRITDGGSEERSTVYFTLENQEIMNRYLSYWKDNYYSYDKTPKEMVESYRYYQLVFDRFYLNDMTIIPQKVSIYKVERMPKDDA